MLDIGANQTYPWMSWVFGFIINLFRFTLFPMATGATPDSRQTFFWSPMDYLPFSWGSRNLAQKKDIIQEVRDQYIHALQEADERRYDDLLRFVRS